MTGWQPTECSTPALSHMHATGAVPLSVPAQMMLSLWGILTFSEQSSCAGWLGVCEASSCACRHWALQAVGKVSTQMAVACADTQLLCPPLNPQSSW